jgi:hypothetical protein
MNMLKSALVMVGLLIVLMSGAQATPITYSGSRAIGGDNVQFAITTDGSIGNLGSANVLGFNVNVSGAETFSFADTHTIIIGSLLASSTALTFDFDSGGTVEFDSTALPFRFLQFSSTGGGHDTIYNSNALGTSQAETGIQTIAVAATAVPEPLTVSIFGAGVGGMAFIRRKRKNAA